MQRPEESSNAASLAGALGRRDEVVERPRSTAAPRRSRSLLSAATYAIAAAGQRALTFLLLPLYTAALSTAEYGRLSLLLTIVGGVTVLLAGGFEYSINKRFFELHEDPVAQRRFVRS